MIWRLVLNEKNIKLSSKVKVVQKQDQRSGKYTGGVVEKILTSSHTHYHGIKEEDARIKGNGIKL